MSTSNFNLFLLFLSCLAYYYKMYTKDLSITSIATENEKSVKSTPPTVLESREWNEPSTYRVLSMPTKKENTTKLSLITLFFKNCHRTTVTEGRGADPTVKIRRWQTLLKDWKGHWSFTTTKTRWNCFLKNLKDWILPCWRDGSGYYKDSKRKIDHSMSVWFQH